MAQESPTTEPAPESQPAPPDPTVELRAQIAAQEQAIADLKKDVAALKAVPPPPPPPEAPPSVRTARLGVGVTGFAQTDLAFRQSSEDQVVDATGDPINEDRFNLRRARLKTTTEYGPAQGAIEIDLNTVRGPQARVVDVEATYKTALVAATIGVFKIPFGYEVVQSDRDRMFLERTTTARALFPGEYDVGARVAGGWKFVRYAAAVQNGDPIGEKAFPGRDPNQAKDITARVGVELPAGPVEVAAGFSALTGKGFHKGTPATKDTLVWRDLNENGSVEPGEIQIVPGSAATPSENFDRFAVGADVRVTLTVPRLGPLDVYGEVVTAKNLDRAIQVADPVASSRDLRELGWYVAAVQDVGAHFQVGLRYDRYDPDGDATDRQSGMVVPSNASYSTLATAVSARVTGARVVLQWDHNRNHLGRDLAGAPVNLKDDAVTLRGEVSF